MHMLQNKTIIWMDETNINLYCRHTRRRAPAVQRAMVVLPRSKGPNVHVIGAITNFQVVKWSRLRRAFRLQSAKDWLADMLQHLPQGNTSTYIQPIELMLSINFPFVIRDWSWRGCFGLWQCVVSQHSWWDGRGLSWSHSSAIGALLVYVKSSQEHLVQDEEPCQTAYESASRCSSRSWGTAATVHGAKHWQCNGDHKSSRLRKMLPAFARLFLTRCATRMWLQAYNTFLCILCKICLETDEFNL